MATTTNYGWTTPDDTALVKDGASAIRSLGTSVDTTTKALNPSTTLGDIEYRSSTANTNTRLGIGSTGQVLTVAGGVPSWATSAGGAANWSLLNAGGTALTAATTITVSGISSADKIMILVSGASGLTGGETCSIRLNTDSGSNYAQMGSRFRVNSGAYTASTLLQDTKSLTQSSITLSIWSSSDTSVISGYCLITGCNSAGLKVYNSVGASNQATGNNQEAFHTGGYYSGSSTISSISIVSSSGNFDAGTVYVYTSA